MTVARRGPAQPVQGPTSAAMSGIRWDREARRGTWVPDLIRCERWWYLLRTRARRPQPTPRATSRGCGRRCATSGCERVRILARWIVGAAAWYASVRDLTLTTHHRAEDSLLVEADELVADRAIRCDRCRRRMRLFPIARGRGRMRVRSLALLSLYRLPDRLALAGVVPVGRGHCAGGLGGAVSEPRRRCHGAAR